MGINNLSFFLYRRDVLEENNDLEPRVSVLEGDLNADEDDDEDEEDEEEEKRPEAVEALRRRRSRYSNRINIRLEYVAKCN